MNLDDPAEVYMLGLGIVFMFVFLPYVLFKALLDGRRQYLLAIETVAKKHTDQTVDLTRSGALNTARDRDASMPELPMPEQAYGEIERLVTHNVDPYPTTTPEPVPVKFEEHIALTSTKRRSKPIVDVRVKPAHPTMNDEEGDDDHE